MKKILPYPVVQPSFRCTAGGFTLVELLVVVAIIAILTAIGVTVFTGVQKGARDARRTGDIDAVAVALESNYSPGPGTYSSLTDSNFSSGKVPLDPLNRDPYVYTIYSSNNSDGGSPSLGTITAGAVSFHPSTPNPKYFIVCARTEDLSKANSGDNNSMTAITSADVTVYYCRRNQQG